MGAQETFAYYNRRRRMVRGIVKWATGQTIAEKGVMRKNANKCYVANTTGTTGNTAPTHTSGTVQDGVGGVEWTFSRMLPPPIV